MPLVFHGISSSSFGIYSFGHPLQEILRQKKSTIFLKKMHTSKIFEQVYFDILRLNNSATTRSKSEENIS